MSEIRKLPEGRIAPVTPHPTVVPPSPPALPPGPPALPSNPAAEASPPVAPEKARTWKRPLFLYGIPLLVVLLTSIAYLHGGRYVGTDNAYVKADKATVTAEVSGKIVEVAVSRLLNGDLVHNRSALANPDALDEIATAVAKQHGSID